MMCERPPRPRRFGTGPFFSWRGHPSSRGGESATPATLCAKPPGGEHAVLAIHSHSVAAARLAMAYFGHFMSSYPFSFRALVVIILCFLAWTSGSAVTHDRVPPRFATVPAVMRNP